VVAIPSTGPFGVLIVDADAAERRSLAGLISARAGGRFLPRCCATPAEALATLARGDAVVIADIESIGGLGGLAEMADAARPLIATSASASLKTAISAVKCGAADFLPKPIGARALIERLEAAVAGRLAHTPAAAKPIAADIPRTDFAGFIGRSAAMQAVYEQIRRVAPSRAPVFITGESGTGKELCAESIHDLAGPAERPFVAINCSALPRELMESEVFGHVRGAFTGAIGDRPGAAEIADGGTLFLDEIADMDIGLQAKLLRFVQSGSFRPLGGTAVKHVDVRLVSATNRDPTAEIAAGRFRADLFYRLHVLPIHLLPLRERREDVLRLAEAFLARFAAEERRNATGFDRAAAEVLECHPWPGNVRQLENVIRRAVVLSDGTRVTAESVHAAIGAGEPAATPGPAAEAPAPAGSLAPWADQERRIIEDAVSACHGSISRAAAALEISPSTIYRKRQSWSEPARKRA